MPHTLLVADDSLTIQRLVQLTFVPEDIQVVGVSDGQAAVEYLESRRPDIALVSASLQKLDGFEVADFIKKQPWLRGMPLLLMAGAFDTLDDARVREAGASGVLVKPFESGHVINRVKELLGLGSAQHASSTSMKFEPESAPVVESVKGVLDDWITEHSQVPEVPQAITVPEVPQVPAVPQVRVPEVLTVPQVPQVQVPQVQVPDVQVPGVPEVAGGTTNAAAPASSVVRGRGSDTAESSFGPADAFAILLAEEQGEAVPAPAVPQPTLEISDAMVDRIADRVAERMLRSVFGEQLRGTVHEVSERLVREEIQRIRAQER